MKRWSPFGEVVIRAAGVVFAATLCSFFALDQPVLPTILHAVRDLYAFLNSLVGQSSLGFDPATLLREYERSLILLAASIALGFALGFPLGLAAGLRPHSMVGRFAALIGNIGMLTPSFALGLLVMLFFVQIVLAYTGVQLITITPDETAINLKHLIAPALTLAARPVAHIANVVATTSRETLRQDFVRVARSKGLTARRVLLGHLVPNVIPAAVAAMNESVMFSLSSLAVIEYLFAWSGVGYGLLLAIQRRAAGQTALMIVAIGLTILAIDLALRLIIRRIDPRQSSITTGFQGWGNS